MAASASDLREDEHCHGEQQRDNADEGNGNHSTPTVRTPGWFRARAIFGTKPPTVDGAVPDVTKRCRPHALSSEGEGSRRVTRCVSAGGTESQVSQKRPFLYFAMVQSRWREDRNIKRCTPSQRSSDNCAIKKRPPPHRGSFRVKARSRISKLTTPAVSL